MPYPHPIENELCVLCGEVPGEPFHWFDNRGKIYVCAVCYSKKLMTGHLITSIDEALNDPMLHAMRLANESQIP